MKKDEMEVIVDQDNREIHLNMLAENWKIRDAGNAENEYESVVMKNKNGLWVSNGKNANVKIYCKTRILVNDTKIQNIHVYTQGQSIRNGGLDIKINGWSVPESGIANRTLTTPVELKVELEANADSCGLISDIYFKFSETEEDLSQNCSEDCDVLVVTPDYPSNHNIYKSTLVHSRNRAYAEKGLKVQVAALSTEKDCQISYEFEGIPVIMGHTSILKKLISKKQYKTIIVHFVGVEHYQIFDGYISDERLVFICHGPETIFKILPNVQRPYFTAPLPDNYGEDVVKENYVKKYAARENVTWVFVSEWLKEKSEQVLDLTFKNSVCIGNAVDETEFVYVEKKPEYRKRLLVLQNFDNIQQHSIDVVVRAILIMSRKEYFEELEIDIYGDGNYYDELTAPLKKFKNVHLHRKLVRDSDLKYVHKNHGVLLMPSRHETHPLSVCKAASSGLVPLASKVTSVPYYLDDAHTHVLSDPEDPDDLVRVYESFYYDEERFLKFSRELSAFVQSVNNRAHTIEREVALIQDLMAHPYDIHTKFEKLQPDAEPVLTVVVPAYNVEKYMDKCILSLINHRNASKCEILIINDGSKDSTSAIGHKYQEMTHGIVKVVDKENGGHGSTINKGIEIARGKYIKLIDGDDWVDSENFAKLIDVLEEQDADLFLNKGCYEYADKASLDNIIDYNSLTEGITYHYSDLLYPLYGFDTYGPLLTTSTFRTEVLRKAGFKLSEKKPYVDMEFNVFSQQYIDTVRYYNLDIYRYLIGRTGQTVSLDYWKSHYKDHEYVIFSIVEYLKEKKGYPELRKKYAYRHYIGQMVDSQIFMFDQLSAWDELDQFMKKLSKYPKAYKASIEYVKEKNDASIYILKHYKKFITEAGKQEPLINKDGSHRLNEKQSSIFPVVRAVMPYGMISLWRKHVAPKLWENEKQ